MKEQDLRDKFLRVEDDNTFYWNGYHDQRMLDDEVLPHAEKCVQIAKDYAEQEAIDFYEWRSTTPIKNIDQYTNKEAYQLFKNRENELIKSKN